MAKPNYIELGRGVSSVRIPILYEDRSVMAVDKPAGWIARAAFVTANQPQPASGHRIVHRRRRVLGAFAECEIPSVRPSPGCLRATGHPFRCVVAAARRGFAHLLRCLDRSGSGGCAREWCVEVGASSNRLDWPTTLRCCSCWPAWQPPLQQGSVFPEHW